MENIACPWCNKYRMSANQVRIIWEFEEDDSSGTVVDKMNYCPFCGRKLKEDEENTNNAIWNDKAIILQN